jgi:hypothetical protein
MKKRTLKLLVLLLIGFVANSFSATLTEDFTGFNTTTGTGYYTGNINGWYLKNVNGLNSSSKSRSGNECLKFNKNGGHYVISPQKAGGIGTIDFWYRHWDGDSKTLSFEVQTSSDSLIWTTVSTITGFNSTTYTQYTHVVNNASLSYVRILKTGGNERLLVDDFSITDVAAGCTGYYIDSIGTTICSFDSVEFRGTFHKTAGLYKDTLNSTCDTIFMFNLVTTNYTVYDVYDTICDTDSFSFNGSYLKMTGIYYDTIARVGDCDSIAKLDLFLKYCSRPCGDLFISEYIEGGGFNKALEIYNPTLAIIDLTQYSIKVYGSSTVTTSLIGNLASGDVHVVAHGTANAHIISHTDQTVALNFNGGDRVELLKGTVVIDRFGALSVSSSFAKDDTYHRKELVQNGNFTYDAAEWVMLPKDTDSLIGFHNSICICTPTKDTVVSTVCFGDSATNGVKFYSVTGLHSDTLVSVTTGCDSIRVLDLTVSSLQNDTIQDTICMGASLTFGSKILTATGTYSDTSLNRVRCDSIVTVELYVTPVIRDTIADTICQGTTFTFVTQTLTRSGNYSDTTQTVAGCDSITVLQLKVNIVPIDTIADTICQGATLIFGTQTLTMSGTYSDTLQTGTGCDSITVIELLVNDFIRDTIADTICQGASKVFGAQTLTVSGSYLDTLQTGAGCDSITVMELLVNPVTRDTIIDTTCSGVSVLYFGNYYSVAGLYSDTAQTIAGCDSITTLDLRITLITRTDNIILCPGATYRVGANLYSSAGTYVDVLISSSTGCDSTITTNLSYYLQAVASMNYSICTGDSVQILGNWYYTNSIIIDTIIGGSSNGCDSITNHTVVTKTVSPALNLGSDIVACLTGTVTMFASNAYDTYSWSNGGITNVLTVSGSVAGVGSKGYILTVTQASSGCSAADTVNITFLSCVGLDENEVDLNVNLYPNPASDFITIDIFDKYNSGNLKLEIVNSLGQIVTEKSIQDKNEKVILDVTHFSKGLYFVRVSSERINTTKKLLIQR